MDKAPDAYRTISEVGEDLDIAQHVLRFWETRFPQIKPLKRGGGRRYYRPDDVELLKGIRHLLYREGYTIKGVQRILKEQGLRAVQAFARPPEPETSPEPEARPPEMILKPAPVSAGRSDARTEMRMPPRFDGIPQEAGPLFASGELPSVPPARAAPSGFAEPPPQGQVSMFRGGVHSAPVPVRPVLMQEPAIRQEPVIREETAIMPGPAPDPDAQETLLHALRELEACRQIIGAALARRAG